jgi:hypothetical protein
MVLAVVLLNIQRDVTGCSWTRTSQHFFMDCLTTTVLQNVRKHPPSDTLSYPWSFKSLVLEVARSTDLTQALLKIQVFQDLQLCHWADYTRCIEGSCLHLHGRPVQCLECLNAHEGVRLCCCISTIWCFEGIVILQGVRNYLFNSSPKHPRSFEYSAALLWEPNM